MARKIRDLTGQEFGRLTPVFYKSVKVVNDKSEKTNTRIFWLCKCSCGNPTYKEVRASHLIKGNVKSCGCLRSESSRERLKTIKGEA